MNTGEKIKYLRKQQGISAEEIAKQIGVSPSTIYRYENNEIASMKINNLKAIAAILHTDASYLMGWNESVGFDVPTASEQRLLDDFRQLNEEGQDKLMDYADDLVSLGRYKKHDQYGMVEEA